MSGRGWCHGLEVKAEDVAVGAEAPNAQVRIGLDGNVDSAASGEESEQDGRAVSRCFRRGALMRR